jgi:hypothetical protein
LEQRQKYVKSLSKRKIDLILEVKEMKRVNSGFIKHLDSTKDDIESAQTTLTRYTKIRITPSKQRKSRNFKQNTTAEEFLRLTTITKLYDDNVNYRNCHKELISEPEVLEFDDVKLELPNNRKGQTKTANKYGQTVPIEFSR